MRLSGIQLPLSKEYKVIYWIQNDQKHDYLIIKNSEFKHSMLYD